MLLANQTGHLVAKLTLAAFNFEDKKKEWETRPWKLVFKLQFLCAHLCDYMRVSTFWCKKLWRLLLTHTFVHQLEVNACAEEFFSPSLYFGHEHIIKQFKNKVFNKGKSRQEMFNANDSSTKEEFKFINGPLQERIHILLFITVSFYRIFNQTQPQNFLRCH